MSVAEILDDTFFIRRGYLNGNHFVYRSSEPVLVDTGYLTHARQTELLIGDLGVDIGKIRLIVNTHCHCDHVGANRIIQERSGCEVAMHRVGKRFIDARDDWATWWRYYDQEAEFFHCTRALDDGEVLAVGPHEFRVIHTPGHSADGIVLYHARAKVLLSSDTLWEKPMAVVTTRVEGADALDRLESSLDRIAELDVRVVYPGHGRPFTDVSGALEGARGKIRRYQNEPRLLPAELMQKITVYTLLMGGGAEERSFFQALKETEWFPDTVDRHFGGAYSRMYRETMEALFRRGAVRRQGSRLITTVSP